MCFPFDFRRLRRAYPLIPFNFPFKSLKSLYPLDFAENFLYPYNRDPTPPPPGGVRHELLPKYIKNPIFNLKNLIFRPPAARLVSARFRIGFGEPFLDQ